MFDGAEAETVRIHQFRPTALTVRAVEQNRLTGLDITSIMYDANVKLATRDLVQFEVQREIIRIERYGGSFCIAVVSFESNGRTTPVFRDWSVDSLRSLGGLLTSSLRPLDLVARLDTSRLGIVLLETDAAGAEHVRERLIEALDQYVFTSSTGQRLELTWTARAFGQGDASLERVIEFLDGEAT